MVRAVNQIPVVGDVRQPRALVKINGTSMPGWEDWSVNNNVHQQADTFRVTFALSGMPAAFGAAWWADQTAITVEILAGFPPDPVNYTQSQLTTVIYGNVDEVEFDPARTLVTITGRDLTATLIDTKTTEKFVGNKKSSEVAALLAARHGLTTTYVVPTTTFIGTYYTTAKGMMHDSRSEWDLLVELAAREEYQVFVKGQDLHFEPKPDPDAVPYLLKWVPKTADQAQPHFNGTELVFSRNLNVAKGVVVVVRSHSRKGNKVITATYPKAAAKTKAGTTGSNVQTYYFNKPADMDQQTADLYAANKHREITRHEMKLSAAMPGDTLLTTESIIKVIGTSSAFDQLYFPDSIDRRMSLNSGFTMSVSAKNHNPDSESQP